MGASGAVDHDHESHVAAQFGPRAAAYVTSAVHAGGADLDRIAALAREAGATNALDLGCGGGHVAFALAPHVAAVTACDLSPAMLEAVAAEAARRGLPTIATAEARAEDLPFGDGTFDLVATRFSAHHWGDLAAGLAEARRVAAPGARAAFADVIAPASPLCDTTLQALELLRDPSHVRNRTLAEWIAHVEAAGFRVDTAQTARLRLDFDAWVARMATPPLHIAAIRSLMAAAPAAVRRALAIEPDGSFTLDTMLLCATAA